MNTPAQSLTIAVGKRRYPVTSMQEASLKFEEARDVSGLGASRVPPAMLYRGTALIGHISYNGRVWEGAPNAWTANTRLLYDNRAGSQG